MVKRFSLIKIIIACVFFICGVVILAATFEERSVLFAGADDLNPMLYPRVLSILWLILTVIYFFKPEEKAEEQGVLASLPAILKTTLCISLYIILFNYIGLILSTLIFMCIFLPFMGMRNPVHVIALSAITSVITWVVFTKVLAIPMPVNILLEYFRS